MTLLDRCLNWLDHFLAAQRPGRELRLYAIVSQEAVTLMGGNRGKLVAQGGHAFLHTWWDAMKRFPATARRYRYSQAAAKITLAVSATDDLKTLEANFEPHCGVSLVMDAGRTVFKGKTITFLGVGPISRDDFEAIAPGLKVFI